LAISLSATLDIGFIGMAKYWLKYMLGHIGIGGRYVAANIYLYQYRQKCWLGEYIGKVETFEREEIATDRMECIPEMKDI
jgi:hypothetical protein